jgi:hypothetical protein
MVVRDEEIITDPDHVELEHVKEFSSGEVCIHLSNQAMPAGGGLLLTSRILVVGGRRGYVHPRTPPQAQASSGRLATKKPFTIKNFARSGKGSARGEDESTSSPVRLAYTLPGVQVHGLNQMQYLIR